LQCGTWKNRFFVVNGPIRTGSNSTSYRDRPAVTVADDWVAALIVILQKPAEPSSGAAQ
jgi:hypothetical protein